MSNIRNCPSCNKQLIYSRLYSQYIAEKRESQCLSCSHGGNGQSLTDMRKYHREWRREQKAKERAGKTVDDKSIQCRICDQIIGAKGVPIHLRMHGISKEDYIKKHLDDFRKFGWKLCDVCGSLTKGPTCSKECKGKYLSDKYMGRPAWNKGIPSTEKTKKLLSKINKERAARSDYVNPSTRPEVRAKISASQKANAQKPGYVNPMFGKTHTHEAIKKIIQKRSNTSIEKIVADSLDKQGIEYTAQFFLRHKAKTYAYDFKIKGKPILIEVDGDYWHGGPGCEKHFYMVDEVKRNDIVKNEVAKVSDFLLIRVWGSEVKSNLDIVVNRLECFNDS